MGNTTPVKRSPLFVFGPPFILASLGVVLVSQSGILASQSYELIEEQTIQFQTAGLTPPTPQIGDYLYPQFTIDYANQDYVVVNKQRPLNPIDYEPPMLVAPPSSESLDNSRELVLAPQAAAALVDMAAEMFDLGIGKLFVNSAYRTYDYQVELFESKTDQYGLEGALVRSAKAGHSEHQTGLAVDVSVPEQGCAIMTCFGDTKAGQWIAENSWRFGFIVRYEQGTTETTGYSYEPWHLRYVGIDLATEYSNNGMNTLEDYWSLPAAELYLEEITASTID